ncbi:MAG: aromatic ring-hydroxylating dioxygenase subunit alpha [Firmicutes bacterium]|nr:aromatic ring-hydroxylating dioxygenase subunit alpha [Bacillota bacterium]
MGAKTPWDAIGEELAQGRVPQVIYRSPELWAQEQARIFSRRWLLVAHESELPAPGCFVRRRIGGLSVLIVRGKDGQIRGMLNQCVHRGAELTGYWQGAVRAFSCPYHGWTYDLDGALIGVPFRERLYAGAALPNSAHLVRVERYRGFCFANLDPEAPPLAEGLGDFRWYLDFWFQPGGMEMEVASGPDRWLIATNWKVPSENFAGDSYHTLFTHRFAAQGGYLPTSARLHDQGFSVRIPGLGHTANFAYLADGAPWPGVPPALAERFEASYLPEQAALFRRVRTALGNLFPNASIHTTVRQWEREGPLVRFWTVRTWNPQSPEQTEVLSWCLVPRQAPDSFKALSVQAYRLSFGPSGMVEQDDVAVWEGIGRAAADPAGDGLSLSLEMAPKPPLPGGGPGQPPGEISQGLINEDNARTFLQTWWRCLQG